MHFLRALLFIFFAMMFSGEIISQYNFQEAFPNLPNLSGPVDIRNSGDCTNRIFIVEQAGRIKVFENKADVSSVKVFLDITDRVLFGGEQGLLGLDFHPDYENNGYFYVNYTADNPRRTIVSRFQVSSENPDSAVKTSEFQLLTFNQPYSNHNGGWIGFGPNDGYLYIATGDGGSGGDPLNNSQTITNLLGKILRIDVDNQDTGLNYSIPMDNPFFDSTGTVAKEIYAWGLRNPWRCSFDPVTGWLWAADVGQSSREEVNVIINGGNYGWRCYEGIIPYNTVGCEQAAFYEFPVYDYPRSDGYSVTGGHVYRGPNQPSLEGQYIYADWGSRNVWALTYDGNTIFNQFLFNLPSGSSPTSFGVDEAGELYIVGGSRIRKLVPTASIVAPSGLTANATQPSIVELNWTDNSNNEDGFRVERSAEGGNFELVGTTASDATSFEDTLSILGEYQYRINAFHASDQSGYTNIACVTVSVVPVEISLFTIKIETTEDFVALQWETSSEINNRGFEIERKAIQSGSRSNLTDFEKIGFVEGKGTTTEKSIYTYIDNFNYNGFSGKVYYRLKQIDFDGSYSYSGTISADIELTKKDYFLEQNFPNPFNPSTSVRFHIPEESKVSIQIVNSLGEVVANLTNEVKQSGVHTQTWNASNVSSGIYFIRINAQSTVSERNFSRSIKAILIK